MITAFPATLFSPFVTAAQAYGLVSFWNLENVNDSFGSNNLTNNGSLTFPAGKINNCAATQTFGAYLSSTSNSSLQIGNVDFWLSCWVKITTKPGFMGIMSKWNNGTSGDYFLLYDASGDVIDFIVGNATSSSSGVSAAHFGSPPLNTWFFIFAWYDSIAQTTNISINNGTVNSNSSAGFTPAVTANDFELGAYKNGGTPGSYLDGFIDSACFGKSPPGGIGGLASQINTRLYNGGNGLSYPF